MAKNLETSKTMTEKEKFDEYCSFFAGAPIVQLNNQEVAGAGAQVLTGPYRLYQTVYVKTEEGFQPRHTQLFIFSNYAPIKHHYNFCAFSGTPIILQPGATTLPQNAEILEMAKRA